MGPSVASAPSLAGAPTLAAAPMDPASGGTKECYRLCINPKVSGCDLAITSGTGANRATSFLEESATPAAGDSWGMENQNCVKNCVRVCVATSAHLALLQTGATTKEM